MDRQTLDMLSRLKGIETLVRGVIRVQVSTLDMLSRLKGIETSTIAVTAFGHCQDFGYAFPFEGN